MKLREYIEALQKINKKHPDLLVVCSSDDEGNEFRIVGFTPSLGSFVGAYRGDFISDDGTEEFKKNYGINAVCLN